MIAYRNVNAVALADALQVPLVAQPASRQPNAPFVAQPASRPSNAPFVAQLASRPPVNPATDSLLTLNVAGTVSRKMDQVGNNVMVTFSSNNEIASQKAKIFGSSTKMDTFTGQDMNQFLECVAQFLSSVNLYQPTQPQACRFALHLLR